MNFYHYPLNDFSWQSRTDFFNITVWTTFMAWTSGSSTVQDLNKNGHNFEATLILTITTFKKKFKKKTVRVSMIRACGLNLSAWPVAYRVKRFQASWRTEFRLMNRSIPLRTCVYQRKIGSLCCFCWGHSVRIQWSCIRFLGVFFCCYHEMSHLFPHNKSNQNKPMLLLL